MSNRPRAAGRDAAAWCRSRNSANDWAKEIAEAAKERADAAKEKGMERDHGMGR